jgi:hypothetical protein
MAHHPAAAWVALMRARRQLAAAQSATSCSAEDSADHFREDVLVDQRQRRSAIDLVDLCARPPT